MEPFYHLLPSTATLNTPSPYSPPRRPDLQSVTSEWLSLTLDPSTPTPIHCLTPTPAPPTPPPLPSDFIPSNKAPSSSSSQGDFSVSLSRTPLFKQGQQDHFSPISAPLPYLLRSSPSPDSSHRLSARGMAQTCHVSKPELMFCTEPEPIKSPTAHWPQHSLNMQANNSRDSDCDLQVADPYDELLSMILKVCPGQDETVIAEINQSSSHPKTEASPSGTGTARASAGRVPSHGSARAEALPHTRTEPPQTQSQRVFEFLRPPVVKRSSYNELFIEEEEDVLDCWERAPPQVQHGVSCICWVQGPKLYILYLDHSIIYSDGFYGDMCEVLYHIYENRHDSAFFFLEFVLLQTLSFVPGVCHYLRRPTSLPPPQLSAFTRTPPHPPRLHL